MYFADQRLENVQDYQNWLSLLKAIPKYVTGNIELMYEGIRRGIVRPKIMAQEFVSLTDAAISEQPKESIFYKPFRKFPVRFPTDAFRPFAAQLRNNIESVLAEYNPHCTAGQ
jgi:uncharacterized protein (DUF885 family)